MPALLMTLLGAFASSFLFRVLAGAGLGVYSYIKIQEYMNNFINAVGPVLSNLPSTFLNLLALAGFDKYLSLCLSALTVATFIFTMKLFVGRSS